jgi:hypothetical protein
MSDINHFSQFMSDHADKPGNLTVVYDTFGQIPCDYTFAPLNEGQQDGCTAFIHVRDLDGNVTDIEYFTVLPPDEDDNPSWREGWASTLVRVMWVASEMQSAFIGNLCQQYGLDVDDFMSRTVGTVSIDSQLGFLQAFLSMHRAIESVNNADTSDGKAHMAEQILKVCQQGFETVRKVMEELS